MSTRSGKRIHKSLQENISNGDPENNEATTERRTRSRRTKANCDALDASLTKMKKKANYVTYPSTDDDQKTENAVNNEDEKPARSLRKHTLKDINSEDTDNKDVVLELKNKPARSTRKTRKFVEENCENIPQSLEQTDAKKGKKNKKKKKKSSIEVKVDINEKENEVLDQSPEKNVPKKKTTKKQAEPEVRSPEMKVNINNSATSIDSYHSAASSPTKIMSENLNGTFDKASKTTNSDTVLNKEEAGLNNSKRRLSKRNSIAAAEDKIAVNDETQTSLKGDTTHVEEAVPDTLQIPTNKRSTRKSKQTEPANTPPQSNNLLDTTFEKSPESKLDSTFEINKDKDNSDKTVNLTFDKTEGNISRISIISDDSKISTENILNTTPVLIESSMETSHTPETTERNIQKATTPLRREGTFTKDSPKVASSPKPKGSMEKSLTRQSAPSPGRTPYNSNSKAPNTRLKTLNVTHSLEKTARKFSLTEPEARATKVMFCSPVNTPMVDTQRKSKVIKSVMKGSNKSFVYQDMGVRGSARKRSLLQSEEGGAGDESRAKRKRLAADMRQSVDRLSQPRTAGAKTPGTPSGKPAHTPAKSESKRSKLPNFAALHRKQFERMESLGECRDRHAKRAKQLLAPTGGLTVLERSSPKGTEPPKSAAKDLEPKKKNTPTKTKAETDNPGGYTRFGFKLNLDVNPFNIPSKDPPANAAKPMEKRPNGLKRHTTLPSLNGTTAGRKEIAKQVLLREKSSTALKEKTDIERNATRTIIKGVRTNRRFELQMRSRNI